jgi:hypothetical protein
MLLNNNRPPEKKAVWFTLIGDVYLPKSEMRNWKGKIQNATKASKRNVIHVYVEG